MTEEAEPVAASVKSVGVRLKNAREQKGLTLADISEKTRIPTRHLESIEASNFSALPGRTYTIGFVRTYAGSLDIPTGPIVDDVRLEMSSMEGMQRYSPRMEYDAEDPAKIPSARFAWITAGVGVALLVGAFIVWRSLFMPSSDLRSDNDTLAAESGKVTATVPDSVSAKQPLPTGDVVFTAVEDGIWVKFYDGDGVQLMQKQMAKGESYTIPSDAKDPQVWTGRPDAFDITVGGTRVPRLGDAEQVVKDVAVSAAALTSRNKVAEDNTDTTQTDTSN